MVHSGSVSIGQDLALGGGGYMPIVYRSRRFFYFPTIVEGAWRMSCTVCTQSGVIEDLMRAEGQRGRELDEKSLNPVVVDFNLYKQSQIMNEE